ncbi:hypothetical protein HDA32_002167 [Spinactinospora alkalitolerans]|uniref:Uncharacterized protein n=1 Tax=Spinactinospora alkalitolerans TaxID=687207 RepID=A0A852TUR8_9ACTN|nr:hypothetical protein [Spinactinospora alkalitolerans]NYE47047.1 hypothetical protein [Spinactinospora alkalitolerans]
MTAPVSLPAFARRLCDDAAVFPPGLAPLADAVPAHAHHAASAHAGLVGPLVVAAAGLDELARLLPAPDGDRLDLAVTVPSGPGHVGAALAAVEALPVHLRALEVAVPDGTDAPELLAALDRACSGAAAQRAEVFVEVPRDDRRAQIIAALPSTRYRAKLRTGGVRAELYPDEAELAAAIAAVVGAGVPFKATAGLHHAVRNTDPETGFEQHGFLNVLLAADAALRGADAAELAGVLAERDAAAVAARVAGLDEARAAAARAAFASFGTCSISDPLTELVGLGLLPASVATANGGTP